MSEEEALPCRTCSGELEEVEVDRRLLWMCRDCGSAIVEQKDLVPILTAAARELADTIRFDHDIPPIAQTEAPPCPDCDGPTTSFGYMGTNLVYPARCDACSLVYMTSEVMGGMTMLFARTNLRNDTQVQQMQSQLEELDRRMTAVVMNRVRESWMIRAF